MARNKIKVVIEITDGVVDVFASNPDDLEVQIVDFDADGVDEDELETLPDGSEAAVREEDARPLSESALGA
jgi:hypothetical protein